MTGTGEAAAALWDASTLDAAALEPWFDRVGLGSGPITGLRTLGGGSQNTLIEVVRGGDTLVLRFPPRGSGERGNATMRREARVLSALRGTDVPHPGLLALESDASVFGSAFYAMETVDGWNVTDGRPPPSAAFASGLGPAVADAVARLGNVEPASVGLDTARAAGFLDRQVDRWLHQIESYRDLRNYPGTDLPHLDGIARWLRGNVPAAQAPGILHGDMHLGNVMFRRDRPAVAALIDWELSTVGDPLVDLGQLLVTWPGPDGGSVVGRFGSVAAGTRVGPEATLVEAYRRRTRRDLTALAWYKVLACFRLGAILEGTHARAAAGLADAQVGLELHAAARRLFERAALELRAA
ncbi:phosphotransferase family protein [Frankia gtarii]|uniref:phosphotransferase family protein n=1 Tax=Frankia gtarii TaxID=2950102 RepID=UPI0021C23DC0|nr:phosphotransferase family protein [Frankia gtarii]